MEELSFSETTSILAVNGKKEKRKLTVHQKKPNLKLFFCADHCLHADALSSFQQKVASALPGLVYCPVIPQLTKKIVDAAPWSLGTSVTLLHYNNFSISNTPQIGQSSTPCWVPTNTGGSTVTGFTSPSALARSSFPKIPKFKTIISIILISTMGETRMDVPDHVSFS